MKVYFMHIILVSFMLIISYFIISNSYVNSNCNYSLCKVPIFHINPVQFVSARLKGISLHMVMERITQRVGALVAEMKPQPKSGCLIATVAFGSELSPQVQFLRNFRDNRILSTVSGSKLYECV